MKRIDGTIRLTRPETTRWNTAGVLGEWARCAMLGQAQGIAKDARRMLSVRDADDVELAQVGLATHA